MKRNLILILLAVSLCWGISTFAETLEEQNTALDQFTEFAGQHHLEYYVGRDAENAPWTVRLTDGKTVWSDTERTLGPAVKDVEEKYERSNPR